MKLHKLTRCLTSILKGSLKTGQILSVLLLLQSQVMALTVQMKPEAIPITIGYNGSQLTVTGEHAPDQDVIIKISSPLSEAKLKYKGKAGGVFWMKLGDMVFKPVPMVYILQSSKNLDQLLDDPELTENGLGYRALASRIKVEEGPQGIDTGFWLKEFFRFKEHEQLYAVNGSGQNSAPSGKFRFDIDWPYQAPPGTYQLEAYAVRNRRVVDHAETSFTVERSGIVALLSDLAFNRAVLYGIIAIVVAAAAGFSVGLIFRGGGGH